MANSIARTATLAAHDLAPLFAGSRRQAVILGRLYVFAGYGIILAMLAYAAIASGSVTVIIARHNCVARHDMTTTSVLFGTGVSPLCGDAAAGQLLALVVPLLEILLILLLTRGPPPAEGSPLPPEVEAAARAVIAPIDPHLAALQLRQWNDAPRIARQSLLFGPDQVREFQAWSGGTPADPRRLPAHRAVFTTLHELGHLLLYDVLYNRGADRATPLVSSFVALFLVVAMPAGRLADDYWLSVILIGIECVAAALATRCVLGAVLTNLEFLTDNYAAATAMGWAGRRLPLPAFIVSQTRSWLRRSHPSVAARREFVRSMRCGEFLAAYLMALPLLVLLMLASAPSEPVIASLDVLATANDMLAAASLFVLGVFGGASAAKRGAARSWWAYGLMAALLAALLLTDGFFNIPPFTADAAFRLSQHGMQVPWLLMASAPLAGLAVRKWTSWFDVGPVPSPPPLVAAAERRRMPGLRLPDARGLPQRLALLARRFHRGFVILAAAEAAVFGSIILLYIVESGISSWIVLACFVVYFAIPFSHAMRPFWRLPLLLDALFQTFFLAAAVVIVTALAAANVTAGAGLPPPDEFQAEGTKMMTAPGMALRSITDGSVFEAHGGEITRNVVGLCLLMAIIGGVRLTGQWLDIRQQRRSNELS